jgi:hypothetical protein
MVVPAIALWTLIARGSPFLNFFPQILEERCSGASVVIMIVEKTLLLSIDRPSNKEPKSMTTPIQSSCINNVCSSSDSEWTLQSMGTSTTVSQISLSLIQLAYHLFIDKKVTQATSSTNICGTCCLCNFCNCPRQARTILQFNRHVGTFDSQSRRT